MFGRLRMRPREVERLTETELALCLDDNLEDKRDSAGGQPVAPQDMAEYARQWRSQTLRQRLDRAREAGW